MLSRLLLLVATMLVACSPAEQAGSTGDGAARASEDLAAQAHDVGLDPLIDALQAYRDGSQSLPDIKKNFDEVAELTKHLV